jgi:predicted GH43/DUF377 family glycosyl hydrolase
MFTLRACPDVPWCPRAAQPDASFAQSRASLLKSSAYHGVRQTAAGCLYRLGVALFDLDKPDHCLLRGDSWIFGPEASYEREGDVGNVTFPCGFTLGADGDTLHLYYGAADMSVALAIGSVRQLLNWLDEHGRE